MRGGGGEQGGEGAAVKGEEKGFYINLEVHVELGSH